MDIIRSIINSLDFPIRTKVKWKRGVLNVVNEDKTNLFNNLSADLRKEAIENANRLTEAYQLQNLYQNSTRETYLYNLYYLEMLERGFTRLQFDLPKEIRVVDIGVSSWFYVQGLYHFLNFWLNADGRAVSLTGYEIDAYRFDINFHSRYDYVMTNIQGLSGVEFIADKFVQASNPFDLSFLFFPFIYKTDHLKWGLPSAVFSPIELLGLVIKSTKPSGLLFIVNQSLVEHTTQLDLLKKFNLKPETSFKNESLFYTYPIPHYVSIIINK